MIVPGWGGKLRQLQLAGERGFSGSQPSSRLLRRRLQLLGAAATQCILPTATAAAATAAIARSFKLYKRVGHESFKVTAGVTRPKMAG